jgi:transcriptional regulator with XRE-family HTH domain
LRKRRIDLGLSQAKAAKIIGTNSYAVCGWEKRYNAPHSKFIPKIIDFLGYVPFEGIENMSYGEKIITCRKIKGLSQEELAEELNVYPRTLANWENDIRLPGKRYIKAVNAFVEPILSEVLATVK